MLDNLRSGYRENIAGFDVEFIEESITNRAAVKAAVQGVDYVFHLAAMISVPESMDKPGECVEINTQGTLNVLQEMGAIVEIAFGSDHTHYDTNPEPHINLICLRCHRIEDCHLSPLPDDLQARLYREAHFQPVAARTDILGFCQDCRKRKRAKIAAQWAAQHDREKQS